jgi:hypothetical protein
VRKRIRWRRRTDGVVIFSVEVLEETGRAPAAAEDDEGLFVGVERELRAGMAVLVGHVVERARRWRELARAGLRGKGLTGDDRDERDTADELEEAAPTALGGLGRERAGEAGT